LASDEFARCRLVRVPFLVHPEGQPFGLACGRQRYARVDPFTL